MGWVINKCLSLLVLQSTVLFIQVKSRRNNCRILRESSPQRLFSSFSKSEAKVRAPARRRLGSSRRMSSVSNANRLIRELVRFHAHLSLNKFE
jgi:hypothetical protein